VLPSLGDTTWEEISPLLIDDFAGDAKQNKGLLPFVSHMAVCQNLVPLVNIKIAGKWMFIPLKMVLIGIDPYPYWWYICRR
jgi:hypothetical protein